LEVSCLHCTSYPRLQNLTDPPGNETVPAADVLAAPAKDEIEQNQLPLEIPVMFLERRNLTRETYAVGTNCRPEMTDFQYLKFGLAK
jgi:hypothetical protein